MTILFLARLYKPHVGGVEKHLEEISKILSLSHRIIIVCERHDSSLPEFEHTSIADVYRIPLPIRVGERVKKWYIWRWWLTHQNLIRQANIIHIHDVFFWFLPFRLLYLFKKVFITFHGYEFKDKPSLKQIIWHKLGEKLTRGNICVGDFIAKWYHTKPNIITYGAMSANCTQYKKNDATAVFIGRLDTDTGIMDYLAAIRIKKVPLHVFGDGPLLSAAKSYVSQYELPVKFYGFVPNASKYLSKYSLAFVSRYLAIIEALSANIPIIAHYNNLIKYDYLSLSPFSKYISIVNTPLQISNAMNAPKSSSSGYNWANKKTWLSLSQKYLQLWSSTR